MAQAKHCASKATRVKRIELQQNYCSKTTKCQEIWKSYQEYPRSKLRETEKNCWEVVLTEEEMELINEFLQV